MSAHRTYFYSLLAEHLIDAAIKLTPAEVCEESLKGMAESRSILNMINGNLEEGEPLTENWISYDDMTRLQWKVDQIMKVLT